MTHFRALRFDRILCLSEWHRDVFLSEYPFIHPSQVLVTRNGIDLSRFRHQVARNPHRMIYSSSPDRGLQTAISCMPAIRQRVPDAELHVFYGFKTWETAASSVGDRSQLNIIALLRRMLDQGRQHGVHFHDRVDQERLAREFLASGVWGYPTWFTETSCITAMEAQAAGLRIVTSPLAALNETVGSRGRMISGDWLSPEYGAAYTDAVVEAMTRPEAGDREHLSSYATQNFGLDALAKDWDTMLHRILHEVERDVVVPYKVVA
jgi:glycosyltransferase involved in cell wall biosynthesis